MSSSKTWIKYEEGKDTYGKFIVSPLKKGMGNTIGNSIRRVLLSSLKGSAITSLKIDGVKHEFSTIPNVVEDVLDVICNLKGVVLKKTDDDEVKITLSKAGKGKVIASDIKVDASLEILNKDHFIAELSDKGKLEIEMKVTTGVGYLSSKAINREGSAVDEMFLDASYSPIIRVNHQVENIRVGKDLDNDKLVIEIWTDGSVKPDVAIQQASEILVDKFELFKTLNEEPVEEQEDQKVANTTESALVMSIDDLELSARSSNCLKRAGIETVGELVRKDMSELIKIKNFGKKSADEINDKLKQFNLALKE
ncbi:DNA-directed RNA polymerase subunit alpha [Candidatus Marinamargulisbacteria bacterium SCGC AAA071-K20]|nr:DNA-directed RNA polymerase subunit alpha [Candidatus Marinamargulisbacteria bacterium SCGC AAA071-K20]